jgi:hypothetical protein
MWDHFVAWKSIMTAIIQNCLTKYGFSTARWTPAMMEKTASGGNHIYCPHISNMSTILSLPPVISQQVWTAQTPCTQTWYAGKRRIWRKHSHFQPDLLAKLL